MLELIIVIIIGILVGGIVNALADELPYRTFFKNEIEIPDDVTKDERKEYEAFNVILKERNQRGYLPVYPDGTPRPISAWLGISAFLSGQRSPETSKPDEVRERPHRQRKTLSWRHPLTEIMTAIFFAFASIAANSSADMTMAQYLLNYVYMAIFALIIVIDMEHKLILFVVMIPAIGLAFLDAYFISPPLPNFTDALIGAALGFSAFFLIYVAGQFYRWYQNKYRNRNINTVPFGYGDVMMLTFTGAAVGTLYTIMAIFITTMLGAVGAFLYVIAQRILSGRHDLTTAIPYGPYIVIATLIMMLWGEQVWNLLY